MAMRSMVSRIPLVRLMEVTRQSPTSALRYLSSGSGRLFDEEERAAENIYIKVIKLIHTTSLSLTIFMFIFLVVEILIDDYVCTRIYIYICCCCGGGGGFD